MHFRRLPELVAHARRNVNAKLDTQSRSLGLWTLLGGHLGNTLAQRAAER